MCQQPEVSVDQLGVETQILKPRLQGGHVVAVHRCAELMIEGARAQSVGGLFERTVGRFTDDAVHQQSAVLLERPNRVVEFLVEDVQRDVPAGGQVRRRDCRSSPAQQVPPGSR